MNSEILNVEQTNNSINSDNSIDTIINKFKNMFVHDTNLLDPCITSIKYHDDYIATNKFCEDELIYPLFWNSVTKNISQYIGNNNIKKLMLKTKKIFRKLIKLFNN